MTSGTFGRALATVSVHRAAGRRRSRPPAGFCASTVPGGFLSSCSVDLDAAGPRPRAPASRSRRVLPTTPGTATPSWPLETVRVIVRPLVACLPAAGETEITSPSGTESENAVLDRGLEAQRLAAPARRSPASHRPRRARARCPCRRRSSRSPSAPSRTSAPASGSCEITSSRGTSSSYDVDVGDLQAAPVQDVGRVGRRRARRGSAPSPSRPRAGSTRPRPPRRARAPRAPTPTSASRPGASSTHGSPGVCSITIWRVGWRARLLERRDELLRALVAQRRVLLQRRA